ncbi:hypothetical protein ERJ75_001781200 [Trypanosoma vivax]|nr:hypothetical protein ERJ75_001781200 [Trypanosoma vivax]
MERVGAEITQVCFARRRAGTQLAEGRGCDAGKTKGGSFACLLPTAPDVLACQELVVKVVCGFFGSAASDARSSSLGLSHVCSREAGAEQHIRARKSARNGGHEAATVRWVWWTGKKEEPTAGRGEDPQQTRSATDTMHQPRESGYRAWRAQPVAQDKAWAHGKDMGQALADEGARRDGSEEEREAEKVAGHGRTEDKSEQGQGAGRQPPRLGKAHAR